MTLNVGTAFRASRDLLDDPMPFVAGRLDDRPMVRHGLRAALHVDGGEVGVDHVTPG